MKIVHIEQEATPDTTLRSPSGDGGAAPAPSAHVLR